MDQSTSTNILIGVVLALVSAFLGSISDVLYKKLSTNKVHFSVAIVFASYLGLPFNLVLSGLGHLANLNEPRDPSLFDSWASLLWECFYSVTSGVSGVLSMVFFNMALKYEQVSKIVIVCTTGILHTFLLQLIILNVYADFWSILGALLIFFATVVILLYKMADDFFNKRENECVESKSYWRSCVFFKF